MRLKTFEDLKGKILSAVVWKKRNEKVLREAFRDTEDEIHFVLSGEEGTYKLYHEQDCCEDVNIESINGDLSDLNLLTYLNSNLIPINRFRIIPIRHPPPPNSNITLNRT